MKTYLRAEWDKRRKQVAEGSYEEWKAIAYFLFDFGDNEKVFPIQELQLWVSKPPLEPD